MGDHTNYFESIHSKDACKIKTCTFVKNADGSAGSGNFGVVLNSLKYEWKINKLDIANGITYPTYKMKCTVDINLGGITPTTQVFFGNPVDVV